MAGEERQMNQYFYFQPRNLRMLDAAEGCAPRRRLKPEMREGIGIATALTTGVAAYGAVSATQNSGAAQKNAATLQYVAQKQAATQAAADTAATVAIADKKTKMWEYIAIGAGVLVVGVVTVFLVLRKKRA